MIWLSWKKLRWLFASTLIVSVLAAIAFYKPVRILVPKAFGLNCEFEILCIDDTKKLEEAVRLKDEALQFAEVELGVFEQAPKFLFCSTKACFSKFSNPEVAAQYYWGAKIILLNENGWKTVHIEARTYPSLAERKSRWSGCSCSTP